MQWASNRQWMTNDEDRNFSRSHRASSLLCVAGLEGSLACFFFFVRYRGFIFSYWESSFLELILGRVFCRSSQPSRVDGGGKIE